METIHTTHSNGEHAMDLAVTVNGRNISVAGGTVRFFGDSRPFSTESLSIPERAVMTVVRGMIVRDAQGDFHLLVDEWEQDGVDIMYVQDRNDPFQVMAGLFQVDVPPGPGALDALPLHRWIIVQRSAEDNKATAAKEG